MRLRMGATLAQYAASGVKVYILFHAARLAVDGEYMQGYKTYADLAPPKSSALPALDWPVSFTSVIAIRA